MYTSYPSPTVFEKEKLAEFLVRTSGDVELAFYKDPIDPNEFGLSGRALNASWPGYLHPDLQFGISEPERFARLDVTYEVRGLDLFNLPTVESFRVKKRQLVIHPSGFQPEPRHIRGSGKIQSVQDLVGSQLFVFVPDNLSFPDDSFLNRTKSEIKRHARVSILNIHLNNREFWIRDTNMTHFPSRNRDIAAYSMFLFPDTLDGLTQLEAPNYGR